MTRLPAIAFAAIMLASSLNSRAGAEGQNPVGCHAWKSFGSWRLRVEAWNWFDTTLGDDEYTYTGSLLRVGTIRQTPANDVMLELSVPALFGLPKSATAPPPQGQLGLGAVYRDGSGSQNVNAFLKQGFIRLKGASGALQLGRFELIDGTESVPANPTLAWLKRERIAHRFIGNFGWSHIQRSFDGIHYTRSDKGNNLSLFGGFPTRGVFDIRGMDTLTDVKVLAAAATKTRAEYDARVFGVYYYDTRDSAIKPDNRPLPIRQADSDSVRIGTIGGHILKAFACAAGTVDGVLWGAGQFGDWGQLNHRGFAGAAEVGFQPSRAKMKPWYRVGYFHASGDGDPGDGNHSTYFQGLPTPGVHARFPFYTLINLHDLYAQVILRPNPKTNLRLEAHRLTLASSSDGWYVGGGAFNNGPGFGYGVRPSGGSKGLANVIEMSIDYQIRPQTTLMLYGARAPGGGVIDNIYDGNTATFGYFEVVHRW